MMNFLRCHAGLLTLLFASLLLFACQQEDRVVVSSDVPDSILLVETDWLAEQMSNESSMHIIDMRDPAAYGEAHIPGPVNKRADGFYFVIDRHSLALDATELEE